MTRKVTKRDGDTVNKEGINMSLNKQTMIDSYRNVSFSPERRGEQDFEEFTTMLQDDLDSLGENQGNYKKKFIEKVMLIYERQSRCTSSFIVGPANYHLGRHQKSWDSHRKAQDDFWHWRERYFKAVNRERTLSPEEEIDKTIKKLDALTERRDAYKASRKLKSAEEVRSFFGSIGLIDERTEYDLCDKGFIQSFTVTSLTNKIRARHKKINIMKNRIKSKTNFEPIEFEGGKVFIENDRVIIQHDEKPDREIIQAIKKNGFRYSPKFKNWCRKHTAEALLKAKDLVENTFPTS